MGGDPTAGIPYLAGSQFTLISKEITLDSSTSSPSRLGAPGTEGVPSGAR